MKTVDEIMQRVRFYADNYHRAATGHYYDRKTHDALTTASFVAVETAIEQLVQEVATETLLQEIG